MRLERVALHRSAAFGKAMWSCNTEALWQQSASKSHVNGCHSPMLRRLTACLRTRAAFGAAHSQARLTGRSGAGDSHCRAICCASADSSNGSGSRKTKSATALHAGTLQSTICCSPSFATFMLHWTHGKSSNSPPWTCTGATTSAAPAVVQQSRKELTKVFEPAENEQRLYDWCAAC